MTWTDHLLAMEAVVGSVQPCFSALTRPTLKGTVSSGALMCPLGLWFGKALLEVAWPPHCCKYRSHLKLEAFFPVYIQVHTSTAKWAIMVEIPHIVVFTSQLALVLCPLPRPHPLMRNMSGDHWALSELYQVSSTILMVAWCCDTAPFIMCLTHPNVWESMGKPCNCMQFIKSYTTSYARIHTSIRYFKSHVLRLNVQWNQRFVW